MGVGAEESHARIGPLDCGGPLRAQQVVEGAADKQLAACRRLVSRLLPRHPLACTAVHAVAGSALCKQQRVRCCARQLQPRMPFVGPLLPSKPGALGQAAAVAARRPSGVTANIDRHNSESRKAAQPACVDLLQVLAPGVVRVQDEEGAAPGALVKVDAQQRVCQHAAANHDGRACAWEQGAGMACGKAIGCGGTWGG